MGCAMNVGCAANSVFLTLRLKSLNKTIDQKVYIKYVGKKVCLSVKILVISIIRQ